MSTSERQRIIKSILDQCHLSPSSLYLVEDTPGLSISDEHAERFDCARAKLRKLQVTNMVVIGNQAYVNEPSAIPDLKRPEPTEPVSVLNLSEKKN